MTPEFQAFATGFPLGLLHAGVALFILVLAATLHAGLSPAKEIGEIREGNPAAAVAFGGVLLGLALPLAAALLSSANLTELGLWGAAAALVSLLAFRIIDSVLAGLPQRVREGDVGSAGLLAAAKIGVALILAAAIAG